MFLKKLGPILIPILLFLSKTSLTADISSPLFSDNQSAIFCSSEWSNPIHLHFSSFIYKLKILCCNPNNSSLSHHNYRQTRSLHFLGLALPNTQIQIVEYKSLNPTPISPYPKNDDEETDSIHSYKQSKILKSSPLIPGKKSFHLSKKSNGKIYHIQLNLEITSIPNLNNPSNPPDFILSLSATKSN